MNRLFVFFLLIIFLVSCRKGEEDPLVSFRSRNNRLAGIWKVVGGEVNSNVEIQNFWGDNRTYSFTSEYTENSIKRTYYSSDFSIDPETVNGSTKFEFRKDGDFESEASYINASNGLNSFVIEEGDWKFLKKNSGSKNKQRIEIELDKREFHANGYSNYTLVYEEIEYDIIQLSNKNLKLQFNRRQLFENEIINAEGILIFEKQ